MATGATLADPFGSTDGLRDAFAAGLRRLLYEEEGLGPFILVLANAAFDPQVHDLLHRHLVPRFGELTERCRHAFAAGREPAEPADDVAVFLRLMAIGFERLESVRTRVLGPWELQFNQVRSLRPKRAAGRQPGGIRAPFDPQQFHFNKPFLRRETFWSGRLGGLEVDLLFNKFPFVALHALLVPERSAEEPQFLSRARHREIWDLTERLAPRLPGIGFGYNSYGAFASVNHLHFQMFVRETSLPVAEAHWRHNGGGVPYPACCETFDGAEAAWERIGELHANETAYNLIYCPGRLYCLPRRLQGTYELPAWCGGHAWYEMAGGVVAYNADDYGVLAAADVQEALAATTEGVRRGTEP
jgi:diadenosine tetraphosphate (Ap4A) HIT family hydrolase